jgi:hypothetical protein
MVPLLRMVITSPPVRSGSLDGSRRVWWFAAIVTALVARVQAHAADDPPPAAAPESAETHFQRGLAAIDARRFDDAIAELRASLALVENPNARFDLAFAYRAAHRDVEALDEYERFRRAPDGNPAFWAAADQAIAELSRQVGVLEIAAEPGAEVAVDGQSRGRTPLPAALRLVAGPHTVSVSKPGRVPFLRTLTIAGGQRTPILVTLPEARASRDGPAPAGTVRRASRPLYRSPWLWAGAAVLVAGVAVAVYALWPNHCVETPTHPCFVFGQ